MKIRVTRAQRQALGKMAKTYDCDVEALIELSIEVAIEAHRRPVKRPKTVTRTALAASKPVAAPPIAASGRRYDAKRCDCGAVFTPTGPRSKHCPNCRQKPSDRAPKRADSEEMETVWNGAVGRSGVSPTDLTRRH